MVYHISSVQDSVIPFKPGSELDLTILNIHHNPQQKKNIGQNLLIIIKQGGFSSHCGHGSNALGTPKGNPQGVMVPTCRVRSPVPQVALQLDQEEVCQVQPPRS